MSSFSYNDIIYQQKFGYPMGALISPITADLAIMFVLENKVLRNIPVYVPLYVRYVDDIFIYAPVESHQQFIT